MPVRFSVISVVALVVVTAFLAPTGAAARGGNHGCDVATGTVRSDHFHENGDRVIAGYYRQNLGFPSGEQETLFASNPGTIGSPNELRCGGDPGTWSLFTSSLGPGDDRVRLDAVGAPNKYPQPPQPLPRRIDADLAGGGGADRLLGHNGFDNARGGPGDDVIKTVDRTADTVRCGPGDDKAVVDRRDLVSGCERVVIP